MTNIPEDIMAKAQEIVPSVHWTSWATGNEIAEIISAALLSERTAQEAEIARLKASFEANVNEMSQRFRAVNIAEVIKQSGVDFVKLSERLAASEARIAELEKPVDKWAIDNSTPSPILTYENCSVIQDEQAYYVLDLVRNAAKDELDAKTIEACAKVAEASSERWMNEAGFTKNDNGLWVIARFAAEVTDYNRSVHRSNEALSVAGAIRALAKQEDVT